MDWHRSFACVSARAATYDAAHAFLEEVKSLADKAARRTCEPDDLSAELRMKARFGPSRSFMAMRDTTAICIAPTWLGPCTRRAAVSQNRKSETKSFMLRDLSKKGRIRRQFSYAERTAIKAINIVERIH